MNATTTTIQTAVPVVCALIGAWSAWTATKNKRLQKKLKRALQECQAFSRLEDAYCAATSDGTLGQLSFRTALAIKRCFRLIQRQHGQTTPSMTLLEIERELAKL
jgi:hypothetical protein